MTDAPSETRRPGRARRSGRRGGESGTRDAILASARTRFGDLGYDRTTIRGIAADAGVDAALVHHFYGSKEQLWPGPDPGGASPADRARGLGGGRD